MKIDEYIELKRSDNDVCCDIDRLVMGEAMKSHDDARSLLEDAEKVICQYRGLVYSLIKRIDIEDCIKK